MTGLEPVDLKLLAGFAAKIDPLMQDVLVSRDVEQIRGFILEAAWNCTERPYFEHLWGVGGLYRAWMGIDDILDGWPVDYGADTVALVMREFRLAAREWLDMPADGDRVPGLRASVGEAGRGRYLARTRRGPLAAAAGLVRRSRRLPPTLRSSQSDDAGQYRRRPG